MEKNNPMTDAFKITNLKGIEIIINESGAIEGLDKIWPKDALGNLDAMIIVNKIPQLKMEAEEKGYGRGYDAANADHKILNKPGMLEKDFKL